MIKTIRPLQPNQIKICGITRQRDAETAASYGFCALGFILYKKSPRYIPPERVQFITRSVSPFIWRIAVTVDAPIEDIDAYWRNRWFDIFQLHGDESPDYCHSLREKGIPFYKAFRVNQHFDFSLPEKYPSDMALLDAFDPNRYGGSGKTWNWSSIASIRHTYRTIIAGGLTPENLLNAHRQTGADAYDLSSGLELSPGVKSAEKIAALAKLFA